MPSRISLPAWLLLVLIVQGCAAVRSYDVELGGTMAQASGGNVDAAIKALEAANSSAEKDLLYYLELGMLQRLAKRYPQSQQAWLTASERVQAWETTLLGVPPSALADLSSYAINDKLRPYRGHDYEKVMLLTYVALNHLVAGDYDRARVAIRQTHELEAMIAELRAKQIAEVEESAQKRGARTSFKELNGYPVEAIDNPEVNALRNAYQSALAHYLAGFVYEALGEASLAAPGYRLANELQPDQPLLEEALRGLERRIAAPDDGHTEVLFVIGSGTAPALRSRSFQMPVFVKDRMVFVPVSFPVISASSVAELPLRISLASGEQLGITPVTSIDLMARRRLQDDMPSIMLRGAVRSSLSAALQYQAQQDRQSATMAGVAVALMLASAVLETADDRIWRSLPSEIYIARGRLPAGDNTVILHTLQGARAVELRLSGRYAVVDFRLLRQQLFVHAPDAQPQDREADQ